MNRSSLTRVATSLVVAGVAGVAFAAPASALDAVDPEVGGIVSPSRPAADPAVDVNWTDLGFGALGGLLLAGASIAAAAGANRNDAVDRQSA